MKKLLMFLIVALTACSRPDTEFDKYKKCNGGWPYKWHNVFLKNIVLPADSAVGEEWTNAFQFCTGNKYNMANVWGRGNEAEGIYLPEYLPSFFKRRLVLKEFVPAKGDLWWIFTGEKGGFTIMINENEVCLFQRFYNSIALNDLKGDSMFMRRYAEKEIVRSVINYSGKIQSVVIEFNSNNQVRLYLNNRQVAEQLCMQDVTQHQIRYTSFEKEGNICGEITEPVKQESEITINDSIQYQEILGFGGITSIPAYFVLSDEGKEKWWDLLQEYNLTIQREYPNGSKLNASCSNFDSPDIATAHYYGDNFPNGEISDFAYNKKIMDRGGMIIFEFWQLPLWAVQPGTKNIPILHKYAEAMVNYCRQSVLKTGKAPAIVGIQNEIEQPDTVWPQMAIILREALDKNGFGEIKIHMHNSGYLGGGIIAAHAFSSKPEVWKTIDYSASNLYDYQSHKMDVDAYDTLIAKWNPITKDKPFISTELCQNDNLLQEQSYKTAFFMGQLYHKNMVMMNASSIMYCWLLINTVQPSFQASRSLFAVDTKNNFVPVASSFQLRVFGSYSKHLLKGMKRVDATSNDKDILVSAYEDKQHKTLIITNRGMADKKINLDWKGVSFANAEMTNQYNQNKCIAVPEALNLKPGDIITLFK